MSDRPEVLVLCGPTAVGKTALAVAVAGRLAGEIISADSRQIYRGLQIGAAAPTPAELAAAPHHLVLFLPPDHGDYTVASFVADAERIAAEVVARGRLPIIVGGTPFFIKALISGWTLAGAPADETLRAELEAWANEHGAAALHARLAALDPATAARLAVNDVKRVVRAIEVHTATGRPVSALHRDQGSRPVPFRYRLLGLRRERPALYNRIDRRVEAMVAAGWLDEVRELLAGGLTGAERSMESLGYRHLTQVAAGSLPLATAVELTQRDTRRFAKRQMTWFRSLPVERWFDLTADEPSDQTVAEVVDAWRG